MVYEVPAEGPLLGTEEDALDLVATGAETVIVPVSRLDPAFLDLRSGMLGAFFQKLQNYQQRLVIVGDISARLEESKALRDFVYETNRLGFHSFRPT